LVFSISVLAEDKGVSGLKLRENGTPTLVVAGLTTATQLDYVQG